MTFESPDIASDVQKLEVGEIIVMYELDLNDIGVNQILYFTESLDLDGTPIYFGGQEYTPVQLSSDGWEASGQGTMPRPKLIVSNVLLTFAAQIYSFDDMIGAKLTRIRTLTKYLDGECEADPSAYFPKDIFVVRQKTQMTKAAVEFELAPYMDFEGIKIPKRQILRDFCTHTYRIYDTDTSAFIEYDPTGVDNRVTCKYASSYNFDRSGVYTTTKSDDKCGKSLTDCEVRFGTQKALRLKPSNITINATAPVGPATGDLWLDITAGIPSIWYEWNVGIANDWATYKPDPLYTRAFPSVARFQV